MESLFVRVLTLSLTGSAVLLPLLLLAPRLRGRYAAGPLSVLWLVLALRMALPVPLSLPWTAVTVDVSALSSVTLPAAPRAPAEVPEPAGPESVEPPRAVPPAAAPEGRPLPLLERAAWVWLAGGLALVGYQGAAYLLARRRLLRGAQPGTEEERAQLAALAAELGCAVAEDNRAAAAQAEYIVLCVKPQMMEGVLSELVPALGDGQAVVSIAAGLTCETLRGWLAGAQGRPALLRVMPNTPAAIGKGMLALCAEAGTAEEYLAGVEDLLAPAGRVERIAEGQMDAFSAVAGCGPAFVYPFIEALADGGVKVGLPRGQAVTYAAQMVLGAAAMVLESGKHPGQLKDEVCSPGGSTIAGVAALEERGFRSAAIQAVEAAFRRNQELGKV